MSALDVTFETIVTTLKQQGLYESTIIVVTTDNGGNLGGSGSNYPLRGGSNMQGYVQPSTHS
jgi:arylsulfatase A-like enzyme